MYPFALLQMLAYYTEYYVPYFSTEELPWRVLNIHTIFIIYNAPLDYTIIYHCLIRHLLMDM